MKAATRNMVIIALTAFFVGAASAFALQSHFAREANLAFIQMNYDEKLNVYRTMKHYIESGNTDKAISFFDRALENLCDDYIARSEESHWGQQQAQFRIQQVRDLSGNCL